MSTEQIFKMSSYLNFDGLIRFEVCKTYKSYWIMNNEYAFKLLNHYYYFLLLLSYERIFSLSNKPFKLNWKIKWKKNINSIISCRKRKLNRKSNNSTNENSLSVLIYKMFAYVPFKSFAHSNFIHDFFFISKTCS